jgi:MoaA/NifB/PqqE/SkfB family radical SAM enzyme
MKAPRFQAVRIKLSPLKRGFLRRIARIRVGKPVFEFIAADLTGNCNLRCPFCINDFAHTPQKAPIERRPFRKLLRLLPLVPDGKFFLSCLYEPLIHPRFLDLMEMIPKRFRKKAFFTTNLCVPLDDEQVRRMAESGLNYINISVDSFRPELYERLRRGARFEVFLDNLQRLVRAFSLRADAPPLRYCTMALKENKDEIPSVVERCLKEFRSVSHEVRFVYETFHHSAEWKRASLLSPPEWEDLDRRVKAVSPECIVARPPEGYYEKENQPYSQPSGPAGGKVVRRLLSLRIDSGGTAYLYGKAVSFDLRSIRAPRRFFRRLTRREASPVVEERRP